jgi:hypothetical protein
VNTILHGVGAPSAKLGINGDFYIDTKTQALYGPKSGAKWSRGISLRSPTSSASENVNSGFTGSNSSKSKNVGIVSTAIKNGGGSGGASGSAIGKGGVGESGAVSTTGVANNSAGKNISNNKNNSASQSSVTLKGARGATGPIGPQGPQGPQGEVGPAGLQGVAGEAGAKGDKGDAGAPGPAGAMGAAGAQGPAGPTGLTGATGAAGPAGISSLSTYTLHGIASDTWTVSSTIPTTVESAPFGNFIAGNNYYFTIVITGGGGGYSFNENSIGASVRSSDLSSSISFTQSVGTGKCFVSNTTSISCFSETLIGTYAPVTNSTLRVDFIDGGGWSVYVTPYLTLNAKAYVAQVGTIQ